MTEISNVRQARIIQWLQESQALGIKELAARLDVSEMTVHRDLNQLAQAGHVEKVRGGARLADAPAREGAASRCTLCGMRVQQRTLMTIQLQDGAQLQACCPHCGILLLQRHADVAVALARDFLYGRITNALQAYYVVESDVQLCCLPSTICFASRTDAERFQRGFGGQVMTYSDVLAHHSQQHTPGASQSA